MESRMRCEVQVRLGEKRWGNGLPRPVSYSTLDNKGLALFGCSDRSFQPGVCGLVDQAKNDCRHRHGCAADGMVPEKAGARSRAPLGSLQSICCRGLSGSPKGVRNGVLDES